MMPRTVVATTTTTTGGAESVSSHHSATPLEQQLSLLVCIRCLRTAHLAPPPIVIPFYQNACHLTPSAILWLGSWYSALGWICEMPSGILSDIWGRKLTLQLAFLGLGACWIVTYGSSKSSSSSMVVIWLGLAQLCRAIGSSLYSGTDMAFLYELLKKYQRQNSNHNDLVLKLESRQVVLSTMTEAAIAALGSILCQSVGEPTTVLMSAIPLLIAATLCCGLEETTKTATRNGTRKAKKEETSLSTDDKLSNDEIKSSTSGVTEKKSNNNSKLSRQSYFVNFMKEQQETLLQKPSSNEPSLLVLFGVGVVLNCGTYVAATALNPLLWQQVGISTFGGYVQASNGGISALGAILAPTLKEQCARRQRRKEAVENNNDGTQGLLLLLLSTSAVAYGIMTWNAFSSTTATAVSSSHDSTANANSSFSSSNNIIISLSTIFASWLLSFVRGLAWPVLGSALNAAIRDNSSRATTLSLFSGAIKMGMVVTGMVLGSILRTSSIGHACALCGSVLIVAAIAIIVGLPQGTTTINDECPKANDDDKNKKKQ